MCAESEDDDELADLYSDSGCSGGTMYGMLLESIQHYIQQLHGPGSWDKVLEHAGLKNVVFTTHRRYRDDIMVNLARSLALVMQDRSVDSYMEYFGQCFVQYWTHYGYDTIMRASGRHYRDFLHGIDNLHETMRFSYPKMLTPSFYVDREDCHGCLLHYRSTRVGFTYYVIGQLRQSGRKFYNVDVNIDVIEVNETAKGVHIVYWLKFDNSVYRPAEIEKALYPAVLEFPSLTVKEFFKAFPFSMVFNKEMQIVHVGRTTQELLGGSTLIGMNVTDKFNLRRPRMDFTWANVICLQRVVFELQSVSPVRLRPRDGSKEIKKYSERHLLLKGQMRYIPELQGIAFLGTPLLNNLEELLSMGLYINELNMYDGSRDMVMAGWQHASKLESLIEQQVEKCRLISENMRQLDAWRQKSESLLYSMLPQQIADRLRNGENPVNTCEMFNEVTILFSYTLGFHEMCANTPATELVECINNIFITFDAVVENHNVFKVETLGDAVYMVAGGVPERRANHAVSVASVGLELIEKVRQMNCPCAVNGPLQIRLGMHTGSIVAGVVGKRTPQYCLFGDTVNTASRMQTNSEAGRIHISEPCQRCLQDTEFVTVFRGLMHVKGKGKMNTYWLAGRKNDPSIDTIYEQLQYSHKEATHCLSNDTFDLRKSHKKSEMSLVSSDSSLASPPPYSTSQDLALTQITTEDQEYISFSAKRDASSVSSVTSSLSRSDSYMSIQEMLCQHSRRCSTGEMTTFRTSQRSARRQSESMVTIRVCSETPNTVEPVRPMSSKRLTKCPNVTQNSLCDTTQNNKSDMSPTVLLKDDRDKRNAARTQIEEWKEKAMQERERERRELDDLVDSLPVPVRPGRRRPLSSGTCPFSQMYNDPSHTSKELNDTGHVNGQMDETCSPSDIDQEVSACPVSGFRSGLSKSTHRSDSVGNSLAHAVTRSILSPSRDDCWNSVVSTSSCGASSQDVSSDEDIPPLIHHEHISLTSPQAREHITFTSPQAREHISSTSPPVGQQAWSTNKHNKVTSAKQSHLSNGICVSPTILQDGSDTRNEMSGEISSEVNLICVNDIAQHSSGMGVTPNTHKLAGCPAACDIHETPSNGSLVYCTDILTNLDCNGSALRPYLRTRSNTISTGHARSHASCDCLLRRRHSASGKLSLCMIGMCDKRQTLGNRSFSESEADLMSFSSLSNIHTCCQAVDGQLDMVKRNLLDMSLPELHYQSLLETDFRKKTPTDASAPSMA